MSLATKNQQRKTSHPTGLRRAAALVSGLGHPLLTTLGFAAYMARQRLPPAVAGWVVGSVALVVAPVAWWSWWQTRRGVYSNFDVSERRQRHTLYPGLLALLGAATALLFWQQQVPQFRYGLLAAWLMLLVCYGLNFWLKVSLHAAMSFFLACAVLRLAGGGWGGLALGLAGLVAASRLLLGRHTLPEVLAGAALGLATGGGLAFLSGKL